MIEASRDDDPCDDPPALDTPVQPSAIAGFSLCAWYGILPAWPLPADRLTNEIFERSVRTFFSEALRSRRLAVLRCGGCQRDPVCCRTPLNHLHPVARPVVRDTRRRRWRRNHRRAGASLPRRSSKQSATGCRFATVAGPPTMIELGGLLLGPFTGPESRSAQTVHSTGLPRLQELSS